MSARERVQILAIATAVCTLIIAVSLAARQRQRRQSPSANQALSRAWQLRPTLQLAQEIIDNRNLIGLTPKEVAGIIGPAALSMDPQRLPSGELEHTSFHVAIKGQIVVTYHNNKVSKVHIYTPVPRKQRR